ncbi:MAG: hypothetical protein O2923_11860 [Verrucomicrobia bacterium]|nr:hypothetical protein [Verrucomicrobiota bacterium]MDA1087229.1 hypothetical protein [Verrucomicrobiota bacterium]
MIEYALLILYVIVGATMLVWGLQRVDRLFQYPFLAGVGWILFLLPQIIGLMRHPDRLPEGVVRDGAVALTLSVFIGCALAGFAGYCILPPSREDHRLSRPFEPTRLFVLGAVLLGASFLGYSGLASLCGGYLAYFTAEGSYRLTWSGRPVACYFFLQLVFPGLACVFVSALRKPHVLKWVTVALACVIPLGMVIFLGRRSVAVFLAMILGGGLFFERGWRPSRLAVAAAVLLGTAGVYLAPQYRQYSQLGGDWTAMRQIDVKKSLHDVYDSKRSSEFEHAVVTIAGTFSEGRHGFGRGYYNAIVHQFVPRLIFGNAFKQSLYVDEPDLEEMTVQHYGWRPKYGSTLTGPGDGFREFSFGVIPIFGLIGFLFRVFWDSAYHRRSDLARLLYVLLAPLAIQTATNTLHTVIPRVVYMIAYLMPVILCARMQTDAARHVPATRTETIP